jgi:formate/nitrite transporter FocA (FNT family)
VATAPEPDEIYRRTQEEGRRRLSRPPLELAATAALGGFDVAIGITALGLAAGAVGPRYGDGLAHLLGSLAFGVAFIFIVVGRSELFTENFLLPIAGLERRERRSWWKLAELWTATPVINIVAGSLLVLLLTTHGVLPDGTGKALDDAAAPLVANGALAAFFGAVVAGALITAMTWFVEGSETMGGRILLAWIVGSLLALGSFNHVIVATLELLFATRYGGHVGWGQLFGNFGIAFAGNMVGGVLFVTLTRFGQALGAQKRGS